jgi:hypothetical protein
LAPWPGASYGATQATQLETGYDIESNHSHEGDELKCLIAPRSKVLFPGNIEYPVGVVLDTPMSSDRFEYDSVRELRRRNTSDVVMFFDSGFRSLKIDACFLDSPFAAYKHEFDYMHQGFSLCLGRLE